jgi:hypothetical protein
MKSVVSKEYINFLNEIKSRIVTARIQAIRSVNKELINLYWDIGMTIVKRQKKYKWGDSIVEALARDLGWSRNILLNQIKARAYHYQKSMPKQHNFSKTLPVHRYGRN